MLNARQILVNAVGLAALGVGLSGCGLRGPLYLPTTPEAAQRATLPQLLIPGGAPAAQPSAGKDDPAAATKGGASQTNGGKAAADKP